MGLLAVALGRLAHAHGHDWFPNDPSGMGLMIPTHMPWLPMEFAFVFAMWTVMMVAMMTPSAAPMVLMHARVGRQTEAQSRPLTATVWFAVGYFLVWVAFSALATLVQWAFERTALLDHSMATSSNAIAAMAHEELKRPLALGKAIV